MLQILIWGIGILLIGLGFLFLYITRSFPVIEVRTKYRCDSCGKVHKTNQNKCECGGYFFPVRETDISGDQPAIFRYVAILLIISGPVLIGIANSQAASVSGTLRGLGY